MHEKVVTHSHAHAIVHVVECCGDWLLPVGNVSILESFPVVRALV